jgi:nitroimidazol reductase NimA-like FMN-containing flavoprotein (pyridoxamine 5'-phosphate oxidase superfamily)
MPRQDVRMTPAEIAAFLAGKRRALIGTLDATGAPDGEPAAFAHADGTSTFTVARGGPTDTNLRADPRVVCSVEEFPSYAGIRGVAVHGGAVVVAEAAGAVTFRIDRPRLESFDFAKMRRP